VDALPGKATLPEWIHSQGFYFPPGARGEVGFSGFIPTNKEGKKKEKKDERVPNAITTLFLQE